MSIGRTPDTAVRPCSRRFYTDAGSRAEEPSLRFITRREGKNTTSNSRVGVKPTTTRPNGRTWTFGVVNAAKVIALVALALFTSTAPAQSSSAFTKDMRIVQRLGEQVPLDVKFKDETGATVRFGDMLKTRPVLLLPIFYSCQTMCAVETEGLIKTLTQATKFGKLRVGGDLDILMLSINPKETPQLAASKKNFYMDAFAQPSAEPHWHLLTGDLTSIRKVTDAVGFFYHYDPKTGVIRHPTGSVILTPKGKISSYTIGNEFPSRILELGLADASAERVGPKADQTFMFGCVMLDPGTGRLRPVIENITRVACVVTLFVLVCSIVSMSIKYKRYPIHVKAPRRGDSLGR